MGLLPSAVTTVYGPADPILSADLVEIQENIVGHYRKEWLRRFTPTFIEGTGGGFVGVTNPLGATFPTVLGSSATSVSTFSIPFELGPTVAGGSDEVFDFGIDLFGNGGTIDVTVFYYETVSTARVILGAVTPTVGASWNSIGISPLTAKDMSVIGAGAPYLRFRVSAIGAICVGDVVAGFRRLP